MAAKTQTCPTCNEKVAVVDGFLAAHDRTPDPDAWTDIEQGPERCRWSNEPAELIVD